MQYRISYNNALDHYLDIILDVNKVMSKSIYLQLPAWRPGRYELANFAANIRSLTATHQGEVLPMKKVAKDRWKIYATASKNIQVKYQYYAYQLDAGGSLLNDRQLYINFINCLLYVEGRLNVPCTVHLKLPASYRVACALSVMPSMHQLKAKDYYQLVDSPMIASRHLRHWTYRIDKWKFHLWFMGPHKLSRNKVVRAFEAFSRTQIKLMKGFPVPEYHFLYQFPAKRIYHGVEHGASTVIVLGPGHEVHKKRYMDFLGVSSHELFHAWNIKKIRPEGLLPYDFSKENYFEEGFVAEGFTTYYGDLLLMRSRVFDTDQYFRELNRLFKRHFENQGRFYASLTASSLDLWLDGYSAGAPGRKVSIYTKGAIIGLMLDLLLRNMSNDQHSLDRVMQMLWSRFGEKHRGYETVDIQNLCEELSGNSFDAFFQDYVYGLKPVEAELSMLLNHVGCELEKRPSRQKLKRQFGIWGIATDDGFTIKQLAQNSPAKGLVGIGDVITRINGKKIQKDINDLLGKSSVAKIGLTRQGRAIKVNIPQSTAQFFPQYRIRKLSGVSGQQRNSYHAWLNKKF